MLSNKFDNLRKILKDLEFQENVKNSDHELVDLMFKYFPNYLSIWYVEKNGKILAQKGNGIINSNSKSLEELFIKKKCYNEMINAHKKAFLGNCIEIVQDENLRFFKVKLVPESENNCISRVFGIAIEITPAQLDSSSVMSEI
jgi:hypothetical protein